MDGIRATPMQYPILGLLADRLKRAQQFAVAPGGYANPPAEILLNLLGVPAIQQTMERVAYGEPLTTGRGMTTQIRPEVAEAAMTLLPAAAGTARVAERGAMAAGRAGERMAERVVPQIMERGGMPAGLLQDLAQGSRSNVITSETLPILQSMSREEFLGAPKIVGKSDAADLKPVELKSLQNVEQVPFLDKYTAKFSEDGAVVFDKDKPIASYNFGDTLTVDKKYRGQGIGEELVYQWRTSYPAPAVASTRNKMSQALQEKVWERIQKDIPENEGLLTIQKRNNEVIAPTGLLDYRGSHTAPGPDFGAPLHDLTGGGQMYPPDVYSPKAAQYYGGGVPYDQKAFDIAQSFKDKPNAMVTIYRAVPKEMSNSEKLATLEKEMAAYMKRGTLPKDAENYSSGSKWYDWAYDEREKLRNLPDEPANKMNINAGDWVTLTKEYAKDHGESALKGQYKILSKKVRAKDLWTNADSIHEFGYHPQ